jgi:adenylate cyclase
MEASARRRRLAGAGERLAGRWRRRQRAKVLLLLGVALLSTGLALLLYWSNGLRRVDHATVDTRFSVRGDETPPHDLITVGIDDYSFGKRSQGGLELRFQDWPRTYHARVLRNLHRDGARVIAYDVQFTEASKGKEGEAADFALFEAAGVAKPVIFSTTEVDERACINPRLWEPRDVFCTNVLGGDPNLRQIGARAGNGLFVQDSDGVIRRLPYRVDHLKTVAVTTVETETGRPVKPAPAGHNVYVDYAGKPGTIPMVSFSKVYFGRFPKGTFRGKTVVVGPVAPSLQDVHATSAGGGNMAGAEIQANAIATVRRGFPLLGALERWNILAIVVLSLLAPLASLRLSPLRVGIGVVLAAIGYAALAQLEFNHGTVLSVAYPLTGLALSEVASLGVVYFTETRERRRLKTIFARFVPEAVVDQVIDQAEGDLRLGARRLESTVLFCDLRGFTSFAESLGEEIIDVLNHYLTEMSSAILDNGGTLVAYMGDGIMAVFGAPLEQPDHADRAVAAAREMLGVRLPAFNAWLAENGMPSGFRMGIGLNTGQVMSGNVGSERRMEYTAVGDTTNTASRIEGMTKGTPHQLFISDATRALLKTEVEGLIEYGDVPVRGRQEPIKLWALVEDTAPDDEEAAQG